MFKSDEPQSCSEPSGVSDPLSHRLSRLRAITSTINAGGSLNTILDRVLVGVCSREPWSRGGIMAVNRATGFSERVASFAPGEAWRDDHVVSWPLATSPVLRVVETRQPIIIADAQLAPEFGGYQADAIARGYRTVVLLPLGCTTADEHEMVLSIHTTERLDVTSEEIEFLTTVAHLVAIAVEKVKHLRHEQWQNERLRRVLEVGSNLMELVLDGAPLSATAGLIGAIVPDAFVILDAVTDTVITRRSPVPDTFSEREWRALVEGDAAPLLAAWADQGEAAASEKRMDLSSIGVPLTLTVLTEPLRVAGETVGALLVFPRNRRLDSLDRVVIQEVRFAVGAQIMRHHVEAKRDAQDLAIFFEQLCRTGAENPGRAIARARRLGLEIDKPTRLMAIAPPPIHGDPPVAALRRLLTSQLAHSAPGALIIEQGPIVLLGLPLPGAAAPLPTALLERHVMQPVRARWGAQPIVAWGPCCTGPGDYARAWAECCRVLHLARMFKREGLVQHAEFGSFALLLSALDGAAVQDFVDGTLAPMRGHDAEHGGSLVDTVRMFLDEACRYQATAERLRIHVSTLRYRLRRVEELFGLDVEDAETRFRVSLALRLLSVASGEPARQTRATET